MFSFRPALFLALASSLTLVAGCSPAYFVQAAAGQLQILRARRPIEEVRRDPSSAPELRHKLDIAEAARNFAHTALALPDNGSYRQYAELRRPYAVWNVFAAPEFSLRLQTWCFPVAGCVAYRGYFAESAARQLATGLDRRGDDVYVSGVAGFSTLGFLRDPLLSSEARLADPTLAGVIFHELAHQQLYVPGDTLFSESFAMLVEQEGLVRWLTSRDDAAGLCGSLRGLERQRAVHGLLDAARIRLGDIYAGRMTEDVRRAAKAAEFARLRQSYRDLRGGWPDPPYFDGWFDADLNNASLGALAVYDRYVGTLRVILDGEGGDLRAFYRRAAQLARLRPADRVAALAQITRPTLRQPGPECTSGSGR